MPACKDSIVKHWQPVQKEYLPGESIKQSKVEFSEDQNNILVKVVADHCGDSSIPISPLIKQKSKQKLEL